MRRILPRPSPAMVIALLALGVALAGTGYAAVKLPANSVGTVQLKPNSVVSSKIKNATLVPADFKRGTLLRGARGLPGVPGPIGPVGPAGPAGPQGPAGPPSTASTLTVRTASVSVPGNAAANGTYATRAVQANCNSDERAISGGTTWSNDSNDQELTTVYSQPVFTGTKPTGWRARGGSDIAVTATFSVGVMCEK